MKILYTGDDCTNCESAKKIITEQGLDIQIVHIDMNTREWRNISSMERIRWIPKLVIWNDRYIGNDVFEHLT